MREVFSSVAKRYDLMNDLMSGGVHRLWKDAMVDWLNPQPGWRVLDVAGGTGDIAFRIAERARASGGEAEITVCDINADMLGEGVRRARSEGRARASNGSAATPRRCRFPTRACDAYTIAFGIRNVTHIDKALAEACRVLKPGGRFLCLEFSRVDAPGLDALYERYSFAVLPRSATGGRRRRAYRYLAESIRRFPPQAQFAKMIEKAGLCAGEVPQSLGRHRGHAFGWKI